MTRAKAIFHQIDVTRAIRGALASGLPVCRTEITPDGRIVIFHDPASTPTDTPFDQWKKDRHVH